MSIGGREQHGFVSGRLRVQLRHCKSVTTGTRKRTCRRALVKRTFRFRVPADMDDFSRDRVRFRTFRPAVSSRRVKIRRRTQAGCDHADKSICIINSTDWRVRTINRCVRNSVPSCWHAFGSSWIACLLWIYYGFLSSTFTLPEETRVSRRTDYNR